MHDDKVFPFLPTRRDVHGHKHIITGSFQLPVHIDIRDRIDPRKVQAAARLRTDLGKIKYVKIFKPARKQNVFRIEQVRKISAAIMSVIKQPGTPAR